MDSFVTAESPRVRVLTSILFGTALAFMPAKIEAAVMLAAGTTLPGENYMAFGASFLGRSVWVKGRYATGTIAYFTGLRINGGNILTINVQTHSPNGPITVLEVGNGPNYFTDPGEVRPVINVVLNPSLDLSILQLGGDFFPGTDLVVGSTPGFYEPIQIAGYGQFALQDGPIQLQDGNIRGLEQVQGSNNNFAFVSSGEFGLLNFPGGAKPGYSGAPVFYGGDPIGIVTSGILGTQEIQGTYYVPLNTPGLDAFIAANTAVQTKPVSLTCTIANGQVQLAMSHLVTSRTYKVMRSGNLAPSWTEAHSFPATSPSATWSEPLSPDGRQFYRLEWTE